MSRTKSGARVALFALVAGAMAVGQAQAPAVRRFDAVSIKPSPAGEVMLPGPRFTPAQFSCARCPVWLLVRLAYQLQDEYELVGAPAWARSECYAITARSSVAATPAEEWFMMRAVLEDRFGLRWHREKRQMPVYYLSAATGGLKLQSPTPTSCMVFTSPPTGPPPQGPRTLPSCDTVTSSVTPEGAMAIDGVAARIGPLAHLIGRLLGRPGLDATGFGGTFDIHLRFAQDDSIRIDSRQGEQQGAATDPSGFPSLFTELRRVGLTVKAGEGPIEVFVIDGVRRPTPN
jgi:uncharacterized protein (TIGR03435 family)